MHRSFARIVALGSLAILAAPAFSHAPFDLPASATGVPTYDQAVPLPDAQFTWLIYGDLAKPGAVDLIRLDNLDGSQDVNLTMMTFNRPADAKFAPSLALIGQGLPQTTDALPLQIPDGYGAIVSNFQGDPSARQPFGMGLYVWLGGQSLSVPELSGSPAYVAVWDPSGGSGEYTIDFDITPDAENPDLEAKYPDPIPGDGNGDGTVDIPDATIALRIAVGLIPATPRLLRTLDVSPPKSGSVMPGDGKIGLADATRLLLRAVGLEGDPFP